MQRTNEAEQLDRRERAILVVMILLALAAAVVSLAGGRIRETVFFVGGGLLLTGIFRNRWMGHVSWQDPEFRLSRIKSPELLALGGVTMVFSLLLP